MSNLKPCPFCGEIPFATKKIQGYGSRVSCKNRECRMSDMDSFHIDAWNTRAPINPDQVMRDNITTHNESLRERTMPESAYYQAGYEGRIISMMATDDEHAEYFQGSVDRQREKGDERYN